MTTETNSFRLHRLVNTIELRKKSTSGFQSQPSQTLKIAALISIQKSVKYNDLSFISGRDLNKLRKQPEHPQNIQYESAHDNLVSIRKKYDNAKKQKLKIAEKVQMLESERNNFQQIENNFKDNKRLGGQKTKNMEVDLNNLKYTLEETEIEKKILLNMIDRIKKDRVVYDQKKYDLEKELVFMRKQKHIIFEESKGISEEDDRTKKVYGKLLRQIEAESTERDIHVASVQNMYDQKCKIQEGNQTRKQEMIQLAQEALQEKDSNEKNWEKIYLCHRFVDRVLRDKMTSEMMKFNTVEVAFKNIKTTTGVSDADSLIKKFLNKEQVYGELLGKIAQNERHIVELKKENDEVVKERKQLLEEEDLIHSNKKEVLELSKEEKQLANINQKLEKCELHKEKLKNWLLRQIKKLNALQQQGLEGINRTDSLREIFTLFQTFLKRIQVNACEVVQEKQDLDTLSSSKQMTSISNEKHSKLFRIKAKSKRITSSNEEVFHQFDEEDIINAVEDDDLLNLQRVQLLRNNDKFMKDLKKKYEDLKKAQIEAEPKKKEIVIEKPKVIPPPLD